MLNCARGVPVIPAPVEDVVDYCIINHSWSR